MGKPGATGAVGPATSKTTTTTATTTTTTTTTTTEPPCFGPIGEASYTTIPILYTEAQRCKREYYCNNLAYCQLTLTIFGTYSLQEICNWRMPTFWFPYKRRYINVQTFNLF